MTTAGLPAEAGLQALLQSFNLRAMFAFDLQPSEYHTNVVMSVLAGSSSAVTASSQSRLRNARRSSRWRRVRWCSSGDLAVSSSEAVMNAA